MLFKRFLDCMPEITLGVQNMHQIEISYVSKNAVERNIHE